MTGVMAAETKDRNRKRTHPMASTNATMSENAKTVTAAATVLF